MNEAALFGFSAMRPDGTIEEGRLSATNEQDARQALSARGLMPTRITIVVSSGDRRIPLPAADLALGLRILADLLKAGLPLNRALQTLAELAPASWRESIPLVQESVKQGRGLAAALAEAPIDIPALTIGIIRAGEAGSGVPAAVARAAQLSEHAASTRAAVRAALAYPAVVACAGMLSVGIMVGVVLPKFAVILADLGQELPPSTQLVLSIAAVARTAFLPVIAIMVISAAFLRRWMSTVNGRQQVHAALLRLPLIGAIRMASASAGAAWSLAALLESGVPIRAALASAARSTGDAEIERRIVAASEKIVSGHSLAVSLSEQQAMTLTTVRLARAGEESGQLVGMLEHAAHLERTRAERLTHAAVRFLEPMLILVFAGIVGLVAAALLQAVYSVRPA